MICVNIIDTSNPGDPRNEDVQLPQVPAVGEGFAWDPDNPVLTVRSVTWTPEAVFVRVW